jgi:stage II sporulation protein AA (anti-sigma F factor antagonist)
MINNDRAEMTLEGKLTFADTTEFRKRLNNILAANPKGISILMAGLTFMDSAGLGMLIVVLEECKKRGITLNLQRPQGDVKQLLKMAKSYERFNIAD